MDKNHQQIPSSLTLQGRDASATKYLIEKILDFNAQKKDSALQPKETILITDSERLSENSEIHHRLAKANEALLILNLEDLELIRLAGEVHLRIQWFSARDPGEFAGPLLDHYRGAYWKAQDNQVVYQNDFDQETYVVGHLASLTSAHQSQEGARLAAAICVGRSMGIKPTLIQNFLNTEARTLHEAAHRLQKGNFDPPIAP